MPTNFCFVIEKVLAGMERPGSYAPLQEDLEFLKKEGIGAIVSLTETPLERALVDELGFRYLHLPVEDYMAPSIRQIQAFVDFLRNAEQTGVPVLVHCAAGRGRTGTVLACALVQRGATAEEAIEKLRTLRPYSIETIDQEDLVRAYAKTLGHNR